LFFLCSSKERTKERAPEKTTAHCFRQLRDATSRPRQRIGYYRARITDPRQRIGYYRARIATEQRRGLQIRASISKELLREHGLHPDWYWEQAASGKGTDYKSAPAVKTARLK
jgi:hypothetical protein